MPKKKIELPKKENPVLTQKQAALVAGELNVFFELDPEIDLTLSNEELIPQIEKACAFFEEGEVPADILSEKAMGFLSKEGIKCVVDGVVEVSGEEEAEEEEAEEETPLDPGLKKVGEEEEEEEEKPKAKKKAPAAKKEKAIQEPKKEKKVAEKEEKPVKKEKKASSPKKKGPGVISTIVEAIEKAGKKGITKEEILEILVTTFPDRSEKSMKQTINVQVPGRITREKFEITQKNGKFLKSIKL